MPDLLSIVERGLKAVRYGLFCVNDQLALALDGFCGAPEPPADYADLTERFDPDYEKPYCGAAHPGERGVTCLKPLGHIFSHQNYGRFWPLDSAVSPQAADGPSGGDLAPPLSPGATNPTGHPNIYVVTEEVMEAIHLLHDAGISPELYQLLNPEK